ncbi:MAG: flavodoxin family protein [Spartobacteria bacterium]|nr:flavodoxin family protein [Spartobacteria bacterium]
MTDSHLIIDAFETETPLSERIQNEIVRQSKTPCTTYFLRNMNINPCTGCFSCWIRTPGLCALHDDINELNRDIYHAAAAAYIFPVHFGTYGSLFKTVLERSLPMALPFFKKITDKNGLTITSHPARYAHKTKSLLFGIRPPEETKNDDIFHSIVQRLGNEDLIHYTLLTGEESDELLRSTIQTMLRTEEVTS